MENGQGRVVAECVQWIADAEAALRRARSALDSLASQAPVTPVSGERGGGLTNQPSGSLAAQDRCVLANDENNAASSASIVGSTANRCASEQGQTDGAVNNEVSPQSIVDNIGGSPSPKSKSGGDIKLMDQVVIDAGAHDDEAKWTKELEASLAHSFAHREKRLSTQKSVVYSSCCWWFQLPVLHPDSRIRITWDVIGLLFIIYETYAIPYYIAFNVNPHSTGLLWFIICMINSYFILDIFMSCITAFRSDLGVLVMVPGRIFRRYAKTWFVPDVISGIPWEWMSNMPVTGSTAQLTKMLRLMRVARLLRLLKIDIVSERAKMVIEANTLLVFISGVLRVLFLLCGITHWAACIWYIVGSRTTDGKNWIDLHIPEKAGVEEKYTYSLYFTLTTMTTVGYGDITPSNYDEVCFVSVLLLVATVVFAALMGSLTDLISNLNQEKHVQCEKVLMLSRYMTWRSVPRDLFMAIRNHLLFLWETNKGYDAYEEEIKEQLPPVLRKELCFHIYGRILRSMPFLSWLKEFEICLKDLANMVQPAILSRGDNIFRVGQTNDTIHVVLSGSIRISLNDRLYQPAPEDEDINDDHTPEERKQLENVLSLAVPRSGSSLTIQLPRRATSAFQPPHQQQTPSGRSPSEGKDLFKAELFERATQKLYEQDARERWAARYIQRRWKLKLFLRGCAKSHSSTLRTKVIAAPAYFGESCLWDPVSTWSDSAPSYTYSTRCESRCETLAISRSEVKELLDRYSPWLMERFGQFQQYIVSDLAATSEGSELSPQGQEDGVSAEEDDGLGLPLASARGMPSARGILSARSSVRSVNSCRSPTSARSPVARAPVDAVLSESGLLGDELHEMRRVSSTSSRTAEAAASSWERENGEFGRTSSKTRSGERKSLQSRSAELAQRSRAAASRLMAISLAPSVDGDMAAPSWRAPGRATQLQRQRAQLSSWRGVGGPMEFNQGLNEPLLFQS